MSVTFPITVPTTVFAQSDWRLASGVRSMTIGTRGAVAGVRVTLDQFQISVATRNLLRPDLRRWESFFARLEGAFGSFAMTAWHRKWPQAHHGGLAGFNGVRAISSWNGDGDMVITAPPAGFTITEGDYIELQNGNARTVVIACDTSTSASVVARTVTVRGMVDQATFPAGSTVRFYSPTALFRLAGPPSIPNSFGPSQVLFEGNQVLFP
jgi:hypothetical protein